jgi:hypothetical protein
VIVVLLLLVGSCLYSLSSAGAYVWHVRYAEKGNEAVQAALLGGFAPPLIIGLWIAVLVTRRATRQPRPSRKVKKAEERVRLAELAKQESLHVVAHHESVMSGGVDRT